MYTIIFLLTITITITSLRRPYALKLMCVYFTPSQNILSIRYSSSLTICICFIQYWVWIRVQSYILTPMRWMYSVCKCFWSHTHTWWGFPFYLFIHQQDWKQPWRLHQVTRRDWYCAKTSQVITRLSRDTEVHSSFMWRWNLCLTEWATAEAQTFNIAT